VRSDSYPRLVADIGGTNARFGWLEEPGQHAGHVRKLAVPDFPGPAEAMKAYLAELSQKLGTGYRPPQHAAIAVATAVVDDRVSFTNSHWSFSREKLQAEMALAGLQVLNDFEALALALPHLGPDQLRAHGALPQARGTLAVIGPGTGLGVGGLLVRNGRCFALETEGGHAGFAPSRPRDLQVLECLMRRFGRVSCERLVSGPGLANLYAAVCELDGVAAEPWSPAQINAQAATGDARCGYAVELFCAAFGSMAGDLVLTLGAWDGVFLAGGVVPKLLDALQSDSFRAAFEAKGRFAAAMAEVPSLAVVHACSGLLGAAAHAAETYDSASA